MDARWQEIDRVFEEAVEVPEAARGTWIQDRCQGDRDLEQAVLRLLESDRQSESFLARPLSPVEPPPTLDADERGRRVGAYRLIEPISHGGMGSVYLAERDDDHYRRRVALKLVRRGFLEEELYSRFVQERQILAGLEHPYIARLYEGGTTEDGRPYLVMEYVEGLPIDSYCREKELAVGARLELFRRVCSAVHHAHRNLLVHRDLKPANILVTEGGVPKLLDFGIAKPLSLGSSGQDLTQGVGLRPMTPGYASPEQVRGEALSTASDVYALGVLLYELLTGRKPYRLDAEGLHLLERAICEQEPLLPSQAVREAGEGFGGMSAGELSRRLKGDLDTIVLTALRKEPERRYASAQQLADDLGLHLKSQPISARPDALGYRLGKFLRRNRLAVAVVGLAIGALLAMAAYVAWSSTRQARRTAAEKDKAEQALVALLEIFKGVDPNQTGQAPPTSLELLEQGSRQVTERFEDDPVMQSKLLDTLGQVYTSLGHLDSAEPLLRRALELRRQHLAPDDVDLAASLVHLGELRQASGQPGEAMDLYREALAIHRTQAEPSPLELSRIRQHLALATLDQGEVPAAERLQREVLAELRATLGERDLEVARAMSLLAATLQLRGGLAEAESLQRRALEIESSLPADQLTLAETREKLAVVLIDTGRYAEAEDLLRSTLETRERLLDPGHPDLARTLAYLGTAVAYQLREEEAEDFYQRSLALLRARLGPNHPDVARGLHSLGGLRLQQRRLRESEELQRAALETFTASFGTDHLDTAEAMGGLAIALQLQNRRQEAAELFEAAFPILERSYGGAGLKYSFYRLQYGRLMMMRGRLDEALYQIGLALELRRRAAAPGHWMISEALGAYGVCLARLRRVGEAREALLEARPGVEAHFGPGDWRIQSIDRTLASLPDP